MKTFQRITGTVGFFLWVFLSVFAAQGLAQKAEKIPGTEKAPTVGAKAPEFNLEGFALKKQLEKGPVVLVFYRGFF
jgi:hypothetical protein